VVSVKIIRSLEEQRDFLREWLQGEAPETIIEQAHLCEGASERAYWNHGYQAALNDVLQLITNRGTHIADTSNPLLAGERGAADCPSDGTYETVHIRAGTRRVN